MVFEKQAIEPSTENGYRPRRDMTLKRGIATALLTLGLAGCDAVGYDVNAWAILAS